MTSLSVYFETGDNSCVYKRNSDIVIIPVNNPVSYETVFLLVQHMIIISFRYHLHYDEFKMKEL